MLHLTMLQQVALLFTVGEMMSQILLKVLDPGLEFKTDPQVHPLKIAKQTFQRFVSFQITFQFN